MKMLFVCPPTNLHVCMYVHTCVCIFIRVYIYA